MNPFKEMILLSLEEYEHMRRQVLLNDASDMSKELYKIKQTNSMPEDERLRREGEIISKHTKTNNTIPQINNDINVPSDDTNDMIERHLKTFTKVNKNRAIQVFNHIKSYAPRWNRLGQLLDEENNPIHNSNIVELVDSVTNTKRTTSTPAGFATFVNLLKETNLPLNFLSTTGKRRIEAYKQPSTDSDEKSDKVMNWISFTS